MIEPIKEMPDGTVGFRFSGKVTRSDYEAVLLPGLRQAAEGGEPARCLCELGPDFDGYEVGAMWEDLKAGVELGVGHNRWARIALVTNVDWIRHATTLFGWMSPGELRLFPLSELEEAKAWVAG